MRIAERICGVLLLVLIAALPFELQFAALPSTLQWLFAVLAVAAAPLVLRDGRKLAHDRLVRWALVFVATQWLAALVADEFRLNAVKEAVRVTAGFALFCIALCVEHGSSAARVWAVSAVVAAAYGIADYAGYGFPRLFRDGEFFVGSSLRLSGSFEYPNTAAAYFALSLPLIWEAIENRFLRSTGFIVVWIALLLTYSRGATLAVLIMLAAWGLARRWGALKSVDVLRFAAVGIVIASASFLLRIAATPPANALAAEYAADFNLLRQRPGETGQLTVRVTNVGRDTWTSDADRAVTLAYRWFELERKTRVTPRTILTPLPKPVAPRESVTLNASFVTPAAPGRYLLVWEMNRRGDGWFGSQPALPILEADIVQGAEPSLARGDVSRWYRREESWFFLQSPTPGRMDLWKAAWTMALAHPLLGVGPDNFRLLYDQSLPAARRDTKVRANSLYLEILSGSGVMGLLAFCLMMRAVGRQATAVCVALGVFLVHGVVDDFLVTTPIYFGFWMLLAASRVDRGTSSAAGEV